MSDSKDPIDSWRKALKTAVGALCLEIGYSSVENGALETLTEITQAYLCEIGQSSKAYTELSCRSEPMLSDVVVTLVEMGVDVKSIPLFAKRANRKVLPNPSKMPQIPTPRLLQVGEKKNHPTHIPDYLPPFPDPHNYIKTESHKEPESDYYSIRDKVSLQKRDVEKALTKFIAKTGETESLFADDPYAFPLIANKPKPLSYIDCLMPKEEDLAMQDQDKKPEHKTEQENTQKVKPKDVIANTIKNSPKDSGSHSSITNTDVMNETQDTESQIDNPYLREIKMPKLKGAGKKSSSIQAMSCATKWSF